MGLTNDLLRMLSLPLPLPLHQLSYFDETIARAIHCETSLPTTSSSPDDLTESRQLDEKQTHF